MIELLGDARFAGEDLDTVRSISVGGEPTPSLINTAVATFNWGMKHNSSLRNGRSSVSL